MAVAVLGRVCEICRRFDRTDTLEVELLDGTKVWVCGSCGYELLGDGDLAMDDDEDRWL